MHRHQEVLPLLSRLLFLWFIGFCFHFQSRKSASGLCTIVHAWLCNFCWKPVHTGCFQGWLWKIFFRKWHHCEASKHNETNPILNLCSYCKMQLESCWEIHFQQKTGNCISSESRDSQWVFVLFCFVLPTFLPYGAWGGKTLFHYFPTLLCS